MPSAVVTFTVAYRVEVAEALMARMLNKEEMEGFYPSDTREEAWEKLGRWLGINGWRVSQLDGIADFPNNTGSATLVAQQLESVEETDESRYRTTVS